jgi:post-segregation antitoxin (ccd killing protein)
MKEIIIKVDDELYDRAKEALLDVESSIEAHVQSYLKQLNGDNASIETAKSRMKDLFSTTKGFGVGQKPSREEMHERGRLH